MLYSSKTAFQATVLPAIPGVISRTTAIPSLGNLQDLYPEKFGGVSFVASYVELMSQLKSVKIHSLKSKYYM